MDYYGLTAWRWRAPARQAPWPILKIRKKICLPPIGP